MSRILLINPSYRGSYGSARAGITNPIHPTLGLATIAAEALRRGHRVDILDQSHLAYDWRAVRAELERLKPDIVGVTATTPLMNQLRDISVLCKDISRDILVVGGGAHVSALPAESMRESLLDLAVAGEADLTFGEICDGRDPRTIRGVYRREGDAIVFNGARPLIEDLDSLPMPALHLYDAREYRHRMSRLLARRPPVTMLEFSRGCVFKCDFCASKMTMAYGYRKKSPARCAEEAKMIARLGWNEFILADDIFTSDQAWAADVCNALAKGGNALPWSCTNGIRVESADGELFRSMRAAGCYRVSFGFESGNDEVLRAFGKGGRATLAQGRVAVREARAAGLDTTGFFLLGLSADTRRTMQDTIDYAGSLDLDMVKFAIAIAFPGTPMFEDYCRSGMIRSFDWDAYHIYSARPLFAHRGVSHEEVLRFLDKSYRDVIFRNPSFIARRVRRGLRTGEFFWDAFYLAKFALLPSTNREGSAGAYYARDRWPQHDFAQETLTFPAYQKARAAVKRAQ